MARGLPAVGSDVGGIPELLDRDELVPAGHPAALANKIQEVLANAPRMEKMSRKNLAVALEYCGAGIAERRRAFYRHIHDCTRQWESDQALHRCAYSTL